MLLKGKASLPLPPLGDPKPVGEQLVHREAGPSSTRHWGGVDGATLAFVPPLFRSRIVSEVRVKPGNPGDRVKKLLEAEDQALFSSRKHQETYLSLETQLFVFLFLIFLCLVRSTSGRNLDR